MFGGRPQGCVNGEAFCSLKIGTPSFVIEGFEQGFVFQLPVCPWLDVWGFKRVAPFKGRSVMLGVVHVHVQCFVTIWEVCKRLDSVSTVCKRQPTNYIPICGLWSTQNQSLILRSTCLLLDQGQASLKLALCSM